MSFFFVRLDRFAATLRQGGGTITEKKKEVKDTHKDSTLTAISSQLKKSAEFKKPQNETYSTR